MPLASEHFTWPVHEPEKYILFIMLGRFGICFSFSNPIEYEGWWMECKNAGVDHISLIDPKST